MSPLEVPENRFIRLEEDVVFQARKLGELDNVLAAQQRRIDALEERLNRAEHVILLLRDTLDRIGGYRDAAPPHYTYPG